MSKVNGFEDEIQLLLFQNTAIADIGNVAGLQPSGVAGNFYFALFTADPTETGSTAAEATFGSYARVAVVRSSGGFTATNNVITNAAIVSFAEATSGSETVTHFGLMKESSGGTMLYHNILNTSRLVNTGTTVSFAIGALTVTED